MGSRNSRAIGLGRDGPVRVRPKRPLDYSGSAGLLWAITRARRPLPPNGLKCDVLAAGAAERELRRGAAGAAGSQWSQRHPSPSMASVRGGLQTLLELLLGSKRREFIKLLGGAAATWPLAARAQQPVGKIFHIGYVGTLAADSLPKLPEAFRAGLRDLRYEEGRNIVIEFRWADGHYERLPALFSDLIRLNVDVLVTYGTAGGLAAKQATTTIPIVFATAGDAVASGLVASLAHPGGNVTGTTHFFGDTSSCLVGPADFRPSGCLVTRSELQLSRPAYGRRRTGCRY
jgi:ABC transporter substrate binding protein